MKGVHAVVVAALVLFCSVASGEIRWSIQDGEWHQPASWGGFDASAIPKAGDWALATNSLTVIADNWKELGALSIGKNGAAGSVTITTSVWPHSGRLDPTGEVKVGDGGIGTLTLDGGVFLPSTNSYAGYTATGHIVVDSGTWYSGGNLMIARGYPTNYVAGSGSTLTINGGSVGVADALGMGVSGQATGDITVSGGILNVENGLILDQGTFTVDGSSSSITLTRNVASAELDIRANATMEFNFDETGISSISFNEKTLKLYVGASIVVDGLLFSGSAGTYELMDVGAYAATGTNRFSNVSITGFDSYTSATLAYDDINGTISLVVSGTSVGGTIWSISDGAWSSTSTWDGGLVPGVLDWAIVDNSVAVSSAAAVAKFSVGTTQAGTVEIDSGGSLETMGDNAFIGDGAGGTLILSGGDFSAEGDLYAGFSSVGNIVLNSGTLNSDNNLMVARGYAADYASGSGSSLTITGGSLSVANALAMGVSGLATGNITVSGGTLNVINGLILDQGTFTVNGSSSSITLAINQFGAELDIRANATLEFNFDVTGISPISFNEKDLELYVGASIVVDGSAFIGTAGIYELMDVGAFESTGTNRFSNVTITGFDSFHSATLDYDDANGVVGLILIDSPLTWAAEFGLTNGLAAMNADPDGDLFDNLAEYTLGGDPTNSAVVGFLSSGRIVMESGTNWFEYVHAERDDAVSRGLSYTPQTTTDVAYGPWVATGIQFVGSGVMNDGFLSVTNRILVFGTDNQFMKLRIEYQQ